MNPGARMVFIERLAGLEVLAGDRDAVRGGPVPPCRAGRSTGSGRRWRTAPRSSGRRRRRSGSARCSRRRSRRPCSNDSTVAWTAVGSWYASVDPHHTITSRSHSFSVRKLLDVIDHLLGEVELVVAGLHPDTVEALDPALVEDGGHRHDALELSRQGTEVGLVQHAGGAGRLQGVGRDRIPAAEDDVVERRERGEVLDQRVATLFAATETDVGHLGEGSDRARRCRLGWRAHRRRRWTRRRPCRGSGCRGGRTRARSVGVQACAHSKR